LAIKVEVELISTGFIVGRDHQVNSMSFTTAEIARRLDGEVLGDAGAALTGFAPADTAKSGDLTFAENAEYFAAAENSAATAIIAGREISSTRKTVIRVANPRVAFAKAMAIFFPEPKFSAGIHPSAVIAASAHIDATAHIGPHCTIGERVQLGANVVLQAGNFIGDDSVLGDATRLFPSVTIYARTQIGRRVRIHAGTVIGSDGFGYVLDAGVHRKVPQIGNVVIGDDVEIGSNVSVDRGALGSTIIGQGTKIDNLVQIAHNVEIGDHAIVIAQAGIAGSSKLGNFVILAGQAGIGGHLKLGDHVTIGAQAGVMTDISDGGKWLGSPAQPDKDFKRQVIALRHLPEVLKKIAAWEKKLFGQ
jgi:UDP-3-O-[3-hydroxymyristoyl] glucosamine N-acyltransferase